MLTLAEHLHQLTALLLVLGVIDRRSVIGLAEAGQRHGKAHGLLLDVHGGDDHLLALAHLVHHFIGQLDLNLATGGEADRVLQLDRLGVVNLELHAGRHHQGVGGRYPDEKLLLLFAFDLAHGSGDQNHAGIGLEALVIDEANIFVLGLLILHTELDPSVLGRAACASHRGRARSSGRSGGRSAGSRPGGRGRFRGC